ncbi:MAG: hypothetical protein A2148_04490 [Chloroflexi bacterium RBG_16_68_14]|nr:MAG: hypothetical protein A2148_04490 [Chloroflexi bacterium RBG_16_68_14]
MDRGAVQARSTTRQIAARELDVGTASQRASIALFVDVANAEDVDFRRLLSWVRELGPLLEARAYGDFRQRHLDPRALELLALGIEMVHCPSWRNGGHPQDGSGTWKRTDDRLLEKGVRDLLGKRPEVSTYILVTSDADALPTAHAVRDEGKRVIFMCPDFENSLGRVLRQSLFQIERAPMLPKEATTEPVQPRTTVLS